MTAVGFFWCAAQTPGVKSFAGEKVGHRGGKAYAVKEQSLTSPLVLRPAARQVEGYNRSEGVPNHKVSARWGSPSTTYRKMQLAAVGVLAVFSTFKWVAVADPMHSPEAYADPEASRHLFVARGPASVPWSKQLVDDFVVLRYERSKNAVLGYQKSTGRVFAQKQAGEADAGLRPVVLDDALVIGLPLDKSQDRGDKEPRLFRLETQDDCSVLSLTPHIELGELGWHSLSAGTTERLHTWRINSKASKGPRTVEITSNHNSLYSCVCDWIDTKTVWRSVAGVSRSTGCRPQSLVAKDAVIDGDGAHTVPRAHLAREKSNRQRFCREMTAQLAYRVLLAVDAHALKESESPAAGARGTKGRCWLSAVAASLDSQTTTRAAATALDTVRVPRAVVLLDIKVGLKSTELIQNLISILTLDVESLLSKTAGLMARHWLRNATDELYDTEPASATKHPRRDLVSSELQALMQEGEKTVPLQIPLICDAPVQWELRDMLVVPNAAFTPESANTSTIGVQFGAHVEAMVACQHVQTAALLDFGRCFAATNADTPHESQSGQVSPAADSLAGLLQGGGPGSVTAAMKKLQQVQSLKHKRAMLTARQQTMDISDSIVQRAVELLEAQTADTRMLVQAFSAAFSGWETRLRHLNIFARADPGHGSAQNEARWFDLFADIWCCAVANPGQLLNVSLPCRGYLDRKIMSHLKRVHI